jgi:uncharacterized protein YaaN involved in tellurite resistance
MDLVQKSVDEVLDVNKLSDVEKKRVGEISTAIKHDDSQAVIQYGVGAQAKISDFADNILNQIRAKDTGEVGEVLTNLMLRVKDLNVGSLSTSGGFLEKIPIIGDLMNAAKKFAAKYDKISVQIEKIVDELTKARMDLLKDITLFDGLFQKNNEYLKELDLFIIAGQDKLKEVGDKLLPEYKAKADASKDPLDAQKFQDLNQFANRFEKKLHDLKLSRMIGIQTAPQIRLIQNNNQLLVEKIQSSILNTIPLWKNQMVIAISLFRQKKALAVQNEVTETTNELLAKNSEMLKAGSVGIARESERGIIDIETLQKVNTDLISTIEETLKIQEEGKAKRAQAETELAKMEQELRTKLSNMGRK